ncbi:MAG: hypothetical protein BAJALOKI2v1_530016 [Promethearchaeota archaeon]|nr:MAG: hypothetical protein BAJALOKI2v1_530016 [Candidatus Lokiarchaeota archaeon]
MNAHGIHRLISKVLNFIQDIPIIYANVMENHSPNNLLFYE